MSDTFSSRTLQIKCEDIFIKYLGFHNICLAKRKKNNLVTTLILCIRIFAKFANLEVKNFWSSDILRPI